MRFTPAISIDIRKEAIDSLSALTGTCTKYMSFIYFSFVMITTAFIANALSTKVDNSLYARS